MTDEAYLDAVWDELDAAGAEGLTAWCDWRRLARGLRGVQGYDVGRVAEWLMDNVERPSIHTLQAVRMDQ